VLEEWKNCRSPFIVRLLEPYGTLFSVFVG